MYFFFLINFILVIFFLESYYCDKNLKSVILENCFISFCEFSKKIHKTYTAFDVSQINGDNMKSEKAIKKLCFLKNILTENIIYSILYKYIYIYIYIYILEFYFKLNYTFKIIKIK